MAGKLSKNGLAVYCLSIFILFTACYPQMATADEQRTVWPLFYFDTPQGPAGGSEKMTIRMEKSQSGELRVGFFESQFFGAGPQWRASGWMATVVSALISGQDPSDWRLSFDIAGDMDGPSAGGLMTSAVLALLKKSPIRSDVTMTGTINPDGSIGPVGGVYYKLQGAKNVGKTKVLVPAGSLKEKLKNGKEVDLMERGRQIGVEVVPVSDVFEAYKHLTGRPLTRLRDDGREFRLPTRTREALEHSYKRWSQKFKQAASQMEATSREVPKQFHPQLENLWKLAHRDYERARQALGRGALCAAVQLMYNAASEADTGAYLSHLYIGYRRGGLQGMVKVFDRYIITQDQLNKLREKLTSQRVVSVTDMITLAEAFSYYNAAVGVHVNTSMVLGELDKLKDENKIVQALSQATVGEAIARNLTHFIDDLLYMGLRFPGPSLPDQHKIADWAVAMHLAAGGNLGYIRKAIIDPAAEELRMLPQDLMAKAMGNDSHFLMARMTFAASTALANDFKKDFYKGVAILGGSVASFAHSSMVVAKYYSLGAKTDKTGTIVQLEDEAGLEPMLKSARRQLRQVILEAQAQGYTPVIPIFHLRTANYLTRPNMSLNDRMLGMGECWTGSTFGRLMIALGPQGGGQQEEGGN